LETLNSIISLKSCASNYENSFIGKALSAIHRKDILQAPAHVHNTHTQTYTYTHIHGLYIYEHLSVTLNANMGPPGSSVYVVTVTTQNEVSQVP